MDMVMQGGPDSINYHLKVYKLIFRQNSVINTYLQALHEKQKVSHKSTHKNKVEARTPVSHSENSGLFKLECYHMTRTRKSLGRARVVLAKC